MRIHRVPAIGPSGFSPEAAAVLVHDLDLQSLHDPLNVSPEVKASFGGRALVLFDDSSVVFYAFARTLIETLGCSVLFVRYFEASLREIVQVIATSGAEIALIDHEIPAEFRGADIVRELSALNFPGKLIGFSSDQGFERAFEAAGAHGFARKDIRNPAASLDRVIKALGPFLKIDSGA